LSPGEKAIAAGPFSHFGSDHQNKQNLIGGENRGDYLGQDEKAIAILVTLEVTAKTSRI